MDVDCVQAALSTCIPPSEFSIHFPFDNYGEGTSSLLAFVHTNNSSTKEILMSKQLSIAPPKPPAITSAPLYNPSEQNRVERATCSPEAPKPNPMHARSPIQHSPVAQAEPLPSIQAQNSSIRQRGAQVTVRSKNFIVSLSMDDISWNSTTSDVRKALRTASGYHFLLQSSFRFPHPYIILIIETESISGPFTSSSNAIGSTMRR